jgi:hypothetical protein
MFADEPYNPPSAPSVNLTANPSSVALWWIKYSFMELYKCYFMYCIWCMVRKQSLLQELSTLAILLVQKTYNITCTGAGGSAVDSVTVTVGNEPYNPPNTKSRL